MQPREIDLLDMIADILSHWRSLLASIVLGAVLFGGISYLNSYRTVQNKQLQEKETIQDEQSVQKQFDQLEKRLDDVKKAAVLATLVNEKEYILLKRYFENSVYMQIDPFQVAQTDLVYQVQLVDGNDGQSVVTYESLLNNIGLYDWVAQKTGIEAGCVKELISVKTESAMNLNNDTQNNTFSTNCLKITIQQTDVDACHVLTEAVKSYVLQQQDIFKSESEKYKIVLLSESTGTIINKDIMSDQTNCEKTLATLQSTIAVGKAEFTEEQMQYYELLTQKETGQSEPVVQEKEVTESIAQTPVVSRKYVLLGVVLFAFAYILVLCMKYIFNTKIRVSDEWKKLYGVPQIGLVVKEPRKEGFLDKWADSLRHYGKREFSTEQSMELAFVAVKIAAMKNGLSSICLMGCNMCAGAGTVCESLKEALEKEQIKVIILDNVLYNAETFEQVDTMQGVVLVEKAGSTLYNEIVGELDLLKRQEIPVLGGIIVE